ncbi:hypothetical protein D3C73_904400 [compost metagenome]
MHRAVDITENFYGTHNQHDEISQEVEIMTTQDPKELLKQKHKLDEQKRQFTNFARSVSEHGEAEAGQEFSIDRVPDDQNRMKSVENRQD